VYHFQYIAWPDHGLPTSTKAFIILSDEVDAANAAAGLPLPPIGIKRIILNHIACVPYDCHS